MDFYNDIDPYCAGWLKNLIAAGMIPPGVVDTRDIREIQPDELEQYRRVHFFAGIGGWALTLDLAGWPDERPVWTGSCPCQPFSCAGQRKGESDERHLWPEFFRLIGSRRPPVVFGEQVSGSDGLEWLRGVRADLAARDYRVGAADLCAAGLGAPHIRQRLYWVADAKDSGRERQQGTRGGGPRTPHGRRVGHADGAGSLAGRQAAEADGHGSPAVADGDPRRLGDPHDQGPQGRDLGGNGTDERTPGASGMAGRLELPTGDGRKERGTESGGRGVESRRGPGGVADPTGKQADPADAGGLHAESGGGSEPCRLADPNGGEPGNGRVQPCGQYRFVAPNRGSGFWDAYDLVPCLDGTARRVEPGTFPLAHGVSGRVGKLRAYGNAIVPQVAAEFVRAYLETEIQGK
jgi:DNA (cytosine-5)-methyltransferase 1